MRKVQLEQIEILWIRDDAMQTAEMVNDRVIFLFMEHGNYPTIIPGDKFVAIIFKRLCTIHGGPEPDKREFIGINTSGIPEDWRERLAAREKEYKSLPWYKRLRAWITADPKYFDINP